MEGLTGGVQATSTPALLVTGLMRRPMSAVPLPPSADLRQGSARSNTEGLRMCRYFCRFVQKLDALATRTAPTPGCCESTRISEAADLEVRSAVEPITVWLT